MGWGFNLSSQIQKGLSEHVERQRGRRTTINRLPSLLLSALSSRKTGRGKIFRDGREKAPEGSDRNKFKRRGTTTTQRADKRTTRRGKG